ncbi:MAG: polymer-forming cytoskeletal protein [Bryobacterales bacterium]|nr:polymer-forming cytoskeletal protein [Bryobacterales bacterium]
MMPSHAPVPTPTFASNGPAMVGKAVVVKGEIHSREDLYIDGEIQGTVELVESKLTIGPNGRIQASVRAREVVVFGNVQGNVEAIEKMDIRKDARLVGDIRTGSIAVEEGAYFKGSVDIVKAEPKPAPKPVAHQPEPAPAAAPSASAPKAASTGDQGTARSSEPGRAAKP